jgi:hypothetical protein
VPIAVYINVLEEINQSVDHLVLIVALTILAEDLSHDKQKNRQLKAIRIILELSL